MMILRILFVVLGITAIAWTGWLGYYGIGRDSTDLDRSVRAGSAGRVIGTGGRIK